MTDSIPPKGPDDAPNEGAGKPEALEVAQHADHPLEAELRNPAPIGIGSLCAGRRLGA
jgi:protease IV